MIQNFQPLPSYFRKQFLVLALAILIPSCAVAYEAPIEYIPAREYFETTVREISQAQKSIKVYMFVVSAKIDQPESKVMRLLSALVAAKDRGVVVEVHLDQNYAFGTDRANGEIEGKNDTAYQYLNGKGIPVFVDNPSVYSHTKAVVIDGRVTIFGSSNWSKSALDINNETNAVVRSEQFAKEVLNDLSRVESLTPDTPEAFKTIRIPQSFTMREDLMGQMVTRQADRAYDIYLHLLKVFDGNAEGKITLDYDALAKSLSIDDMTKVDYRRQINKVLNQLQDDYKLIAVVTKINQPAVIVLHDLSTPSGVYSIPKEDFIEFPEDYWNFGWEKKLSFPAKAMLLINWQYSHGTLANWRSSVKALEEKHYVSETFIGDGMQELRQLNLINVRYEDINQDSGTLKWRAVYSANQVYDPEELNKRFDDLAKKYSKEAVDRARGYAKVVFKENDYEDVLTLIGLERQHGQEVLKEAVGIVEAKRENNPKRHMGYLVGTIKGLAADKQVLLKE